MSDRLLRECRICTNVEWLSEVPKVPKHQIFNLIEIKQFKIGIHSYICKLHHKLK